MCVDREKHCIVSCMERIVSKMKGSAKFQQVIEVDVEHLFLLTIGSSDLHYFCGWKFWLMVPGFQSRAVPKASLSLTGEACGAPPSEHRAYRRQETCGLPFCKLGTGSGVFAANSYENVPLPCTTQQSNYDICVDLRRPDRLETSSFEIIDCCAGGPVSSAALVNVTRENKQRAQFDRAIH